MATDLTGLSGTVGFSAKITATKTDGVNVAANDISLAVGVAFTFGTGAAKANQIAAVRAVIAASGNTTIDLVGALTNGNGVGGTPSLAKVKALVIVNSSGTVTTAHTAATTASIKIEPGAAPPDNCPTVPLLPVGAFVVIGCSDATGFLGTLAGGSKDGIKITNLDGAAECQYDIFALGESA